MSLDQDTFDAMTLLVAREVLDHADHHMEQWKRERDNTGFSKQVTGDAPMAGWPDILPQIAQALNTPGPGA